MQTVHATPAQRNLLSETPAEPTATPGEQRWFEAALIRGRTSRFTETIYITPGLARGMLVLNIQNRPLSATRIARHIDRLQRGTFILTHQGIAFAKTGVLNDGQHRLTAILNAGIKAQMQVTFGAEREEFEAVDTGAARTAADMQSIAGASNYAARAAIAGAFLYLQTTEVTRPDAQMVNHYAGELAGPNMDEAIRIGALLRKVCAPTPMSVAYYHIRTTTKQRPELVESFFEHIGDGANLVNPKLKLRDWLVKKEERRGLATCQVSGVIVNAWNAFIARKKTFATHWNHHKSLPVAV